MDFIKKYGVKLLAAVALISLLMPMGSISVGGESDGVNGMAVISDNLFCFLLILAPFAIIMADYVDVMKKFRSLIQVGCAAIGVIMTFVGYSQIDTLGGLGSLSSIASIKLETSLGFGSILGVLAYGGVIAMVVLYQKDELKANFDALKGEKK